MALNQKAFERKLQNMNSTQESVQTVSLWIIHHKKQAEEIVFVWLDQLKKAPKSDRRLTLFYLANDVLQNSRKKTKNFITAYSKVLREAMPLLSDKSIETSVLRVINIWEERKVFEKDFLQGLRSRLDGHKDKKKEPKVKADKAEEVKPQKSKRLPPADFKPSKLVDAVKAMSDFEAELTLKESQLNSLRIDASDAEIVGHLKDRAGSTKFWQEYEEASHKLEEFCETLVKEQEQRNSMISLLQDGEAFFDVAFGEVKVIVNAYKTFGNRLNSLKKKLDAKINRLAVKEAERAKTGPVSAPTGSFLSTGLPQMMTDSAASSPAHTPTRKSEGEPKLKDTTIDNIEVSDMDIEEDSDSEAEKAENSDAAQSSTSNTPSQTSSSSDTKTVDLASSNLAPVAASNTVSKTGVEPATSSAYSVSSTVASIPNPDKSSVAEAAQVSVTPAIPPTQTVIMSPQTGLVPPPIPPSFVGLGMPVQFPAAGFGVPQLVGMRAPLQNGPGTILMPASGLPTIPFQQQVGAVAASAGLPGSSQVLLQPGVSTGTAPFVALQNQLSLAESGGTTTTAVVASSQVTPTTVQTQAGRGESAANQKPDDNSLAILDSPQSDSSAPSPEGSPELNLDDVTLSNSQRNTSGLHTNQSFLSSLQLSNVNVSSDDEIQIPTSSKKPVSALVDQVKELEGTANSSPSQTQQDGKSVTAVDILAQLLSRGRQLKQMSETQTPPRDETPASETPPQAQSVVPVETQQSGDNPKKPLLSLIDSLFPKLSDSLKTLKQKEQAAQIEEPNSFNTPGPTREMKTTSTHVPAYNSNATNIGSLTRDQPSNLAPKSILKKNQSSDVVTAPHVGNQNFNANSFENRSDALRLSHKEPQERNHLEKLVPPSKIEMERLQARRTSQESASFLSGNPDHQKSPRPFPSERHPLERHSPRSPNPDGPPRRSSREHILNDQVEKSKIPFATEQENKQSSRGSFSNHQESKMIENKLEVDIEGEQINVSPKEDSHKIQKSEERTVPPITNAPLVGQLGTFGYTKQDPTVSSDFGREPSSPEPVRVPFPGRPSIQMGPSGPGGDFGGLRGPPSRPGPWVGRPRDVPPQGSFSGQPPLRPDAPFQGVVREREMVCPDFDPRRDFRGSEPRSPEHFQQQRPGPFQRIPEEGRAHPGPFPRAPEEGRPHPGTVNVPEEGHPNIPEGHQPSGTALWRGPEDHGPHSGPFPRNLDDGCPPQPRFRGPGDHPPPGRFPHGPESRLPPSHIMRRPDMHRPNEPRRSESFQRSPERVPMDFRNDDPSAWTSFESGRRTPPHMINQEQRRGNVFQDRPINSRVPREEPRDPFQNFNDNDIAQRDFMMKRPGPPIRFPGPPPHKRSFPF